MCVNADNICCGFDDSQTFIETMLWLGWTDNSAYESNDGEIIALKGAHEPWISSFFETSEWHDWRRMLIESFFSCFRNREIFESIFMSSLLILRTELNMRVSVYTFCWQDKRSVQISFEYEEWRLCSVDWFGDRECNNIWKRTYIGNAVHSHVNAS